MTERPSLRSKSRKTAWTTPSIIDLDAGPPDITASPPGGPSGDGAPYDISYPAVYTS